MDALRQLTLLLALTSAASSASAQLVRLPSLNLPVPQAVDRLGAQVQAALPADLSTLRLDTVTRLLRAYPRVLEPGPRGEPVVRRQVLVFSPSEHVLTEARRAGFSIVRTQELEGLSETMVTLEAPAGMRTAAALEALRKIDPAASADFNHIYTPGGATAPAAGKPTPAAEPQGSPASKIGLIDGGVASRHPVFADVRIERHGCGGREIPSAHGTGVAALMVGHSAPFQGAAPGLSLYAADIYCDAPDGGSAERIAAALGWLAQQDVGVINMSIVGPPNTTLERLVKAMQKRDRLLVAAAGNDGPAAPPLYPAAYPGVVAVTAVGRDGTVLPEAARGPHILFGAPGSHMATASAQTGRYQQVRGTSFAAPIVAALLARHGSVAALARTAVNTEDAGHGAVGMALRLDPKKISRLME